MNYKKNFFLGVLLANLLTACASAPKPAECKGEFKPVNSVEQNGIESVKTEKLVSCKEGAVHG